MIDDQPDALLPGAMEAHFPLVGQPHTRSQVLQRLQAFLGDVVKKAGTLMDPAFWELQGFTAKEALECPPAFAFLYNEGAAARAIFDAPVELRRGRKTLRVDGFWLKKTPKGFCGGPQPQMLRLSRNATLDATHPLYITDREDIAAALAVAGLGVLCVPREASLFANSDDVDAYAPDQPRAFHAACQGVPLGGRRVTLIHGDRQAAVTIARGLRQGDAHTGAVAYVERQRFLDALDALLAQGMRAQELQEGVQELAKAGDEDLGPAVLSGHPGSVGAVVPRHLLERLPPQVRDLRWPAAQPGGSTWDNLEWAVASDGIVNGVLRDERGNDVVIQRQTLTLRSPVYITSQATRRGDLEDVSYYELQWLAQDSDDARPASASVPADQLLSPQRVNQLVRLGVPVVNLKTGAQWFGAFLAANPALPHYDIHTRAGWLQEGGNWRFLLPYTQTARHRLDEGVFARVQLAGTASKHWELLHDYYTALDPINQLLLMVPHASVLLSALKQPGCVFGVFDLTSAGKSVLLQVSSRLYGDMGREYYIDATLAPTAYFIEQTLQRSNGLCVFIDEFQRLPNTKQRKMGNVISREEAIYLLSNGMGKGRGTVDGNVSGFKSRVYCYSVVAGEKDQISVVDKAEQGRGAQVRTIALPLVPLSKAFTDKYGSNALSAFMTAHQDVAGHVGKAAIETLGQALDTRGIESLRAEVLAVQTKLVEEAKRRSGGALNDVTQRRMGFLAPLAVVEMLLREAHPEQTMWGATLEETCVMRALRGRYNAALIHVDQSGEQEDVSPSEILLERLRQNPALIQGNGGDLPAHTPPLAKLASGRNSPLGPGMRLYPKAVYRLLRSEGIAEATARQLLAKSGDFVLQPHKNEEPTLLHRANGHQWLIPVAGWGWDIVCASPGDTESEGSDPYSAPREAFRELFQAAHAPGRDVVDSLTDAAVAYLASLGPAPRHAPGSLGYQLYLKYEPAWRALTDPLLEVLSTKGVEDCSNRWYEKVRTGF